MIKYMKLEVKKNSMRMYLYASVAISLITILLMYVVALASDATELRSAITNDEHQFIYFFSLLINIAGFTCLGAAMLGKIVMESYKGNYAYLTLEYPTSRSKIFSAKLAICILFVGFFSIVSEFFTQCLFYLSELVIPILHGKVTFSEVIQQVPIMLLGVILITCISLTALAIGWQKESMSLLITTAVILCSFPSNAITVGGIPVAIATTVSLIIISIFVVNYLYKKVQRMEL